jgi:Bacterial Ig domain
VLLPVNRARGRAGVVRIAAQAAILALVAGLYACGGGGGSANPVLGSLTFSTNENVALSGAVTASDPGGSTVTFTKTTAPASGQLQLNSGGTFTYTPNQNFTGNDSFGVQAADAAGNKSTGTVMITVTVNHPPAATNQAVRSDSGQNINVLQAASDPDKDKLTVTVTDPLVGTATVNSDGTVTVSGLPTGFKGLTRFGYTVTDPSGATASGHFAVFVGVDPFRAAFVGDAAANGSDEIYLTDFASDPVVMTAATRSTVRLKGFAASDDGSTIVYRTQDTASPATTSLSFVKTAIPTQATAIPLPSGTVPVLDGNSKDQFLISPDGQWVAIIAGQGNSSSLYVLNIAQPSVVSVIEPTGAAYATLPTFSLDSKSIYFLATTVPGGAHKSLYFASLSTPTQTTLVSAASDPSSSDEIYAYSVSPDQTKITLEANRAGKIGIFYVDAAHLQAENPLNRPLGFNQSIQTTGGTTIGLPPGQGSSTTNAHVAYVVNAGSDPVNYPAGIYVADVSTTPNPRLVVQQPGEQVLAFRPDDGAILYTDGTTVTETIIDGPGTQALGGGNAGWYDSGGNIALLQQSAPYTVLASTYRGQFGSSPSRVGTPSLAVIYSDVSGFDRAVAIIGQGPTSGATPATATLQFVNARAPTSLLPLTLPSSSSFQSPLQLTSYSSKVVR